MKKIIQFCMFCLCMTISMHAYANVQDKALFKAIPSSNVQAMKQALAQGANVDARNKFGSTPLLVACEFGSFVAVQLLIDHNANVNATRATTGHAPLAIGVADIEIVKLLLAKGARVNAQDKDGKTALMFAAEVLFDQIIPVIELLIKQGANTQLKDKSGKTALDYAYAARSGAFSADRKKVNNRVIQVLKKQSSR